MGIVKYILQMRHWESYVKNLKLKTPYYPILGNSLTLVGTTPTKLFNELVEYIKLNETPHKLYLGPFLVITVDHPDDFKTVLMSQYCLDKPYLYAFYPSKVSIMSATCKFFFFLEKIFFFTFVFGLGKNSSFFPHKKSFHILVRKKN